MAGARAALLWALGPALLPHGRGDGEESEHSGYTAPDEAEPDQESTASPWVTVTTDAGTAAMTSPLVAEEANQLEYMLMVLIPLILLVLLLLSVVLLATYFRRKRAKQEASSQGSQSVLQTYDLGSETLKVPIFEEDTPSVMEIEMEELDKWMSSMNRNADCECLPTLKEEKESNHNPSDSES